MRELSLFTGAGGGVKGTHLVGLKPVGYVEWNTYCQKVLAQRIKDGLIREAPIFGDVRKFVQSGYAEKYRGFAEVVSAGFPCQPFSCAGGQLAAEDERNMWPATRDVIRVVRPAIAWLENVTGLFTTGYCEVIFGDLAELGYDVEWGVFSGAGEGAPHRRDRFFGFAYDRSQRIPWDLIQTLERKPRLPWGENGGGDEDWARRSGISEPLLRRLGDGLGNGVERLKAAGNGQIPIVVAAAWSELSERAKRRNLAA